MVEIVQPGVGTITAVSVVRDPTHIVTDAVEIDFTSGATVTDLGGGIAGVSVTGGGGTPGGANTTFQYNNSSVFGGTVDGVFDNTSGNTKFGFGFTDIADLGEAKMQVNGQTGLGHVLSVTVNGKSPGTLYTVNDVLTLVGGNNDCTVNVDSVDGGGAITGVTIITPGTEYTLGDYSTTGGTGSGVLITVTLVSLPFTIQQWYDRFGNSVMRLAYDSDSTDFNPTLNITSLQTGLTAPVPSSNTKMVITDDTGQLSFTDIPVFVVQLPNYTAPNDSSITLQSGVTTGGGAPGIGLTASNGFASGDQLGGDVIGTGGVGFGAGAGGQVFFTGGLGGETGDGGLVSLFGGTGGATSGAGGSISITAGSAQAGDGNGGSVSIDVGLKNGTGQTGNFVVSNSNANSFLGIRGSDGKVFVQSLNASAAVLFDGSALSSDRTVTFQDQNGTIALLSDIPTFTASTYTPSATNVTNITSSTPNNSTYSRVGNIVTVFGSITITNTLAVASEVDVSLPIASNLGAATDLNGTATINTAVALNLYIKGDATNDRASIFFTAVGVGGSGTIYYSYQYQVI